MTAFKTILTAAVIISAPIAAFPQRVGLSIGMPASQATAPISNNAGQLNAAQLQPLPTLPPLLSSPGRLLVPQLSLTLKPLNLVSTHLSPPQINFEPAVGRAILPTLPFALDPIAVGTIPQMCVEATLGMPGLNWADSKTGNLSK